MDIHAFIRGLPDLYGGDLSATAPLDRRFRALMDDVPGWASENKLAMLNLAAGLMEPGEAYLEVGSYKGLSIIAAMLGNDRGHFYAIEHFRGFGMKPREARAELKTNLRRWGMADRLRLLEGDCFRILLDGRAVREPVAVYFYDGSHGRLAHYMALGVAEHLLADDAVVIVDDTSWKRVAGATGRYVDAHPGYELLFDLHTARDSDPAWWNGVRVYRFRRSAAWVSRAGARDMRWRGFAHRATDPMMRAVGMAAVRTLSGRPRLTAAARRIAALGSPRRTA